MTHAQTPQPGFIVRLLTLVASIFLLVAGFMFSVLLLTVIAVTGLLTWAYFWWKTRELRKTMNANPTDRSVIEGKATVVDTSRERGSANLSARPQSSSF